MSLSISELAKSAGVGVETVRYYQRKKLLFDPRPSQSGPVPGRKHYGSEEVRRLRFIRSAQAAGFTLREIGELLELDSTHDRPRAREMARARIVALDQQIGELQRARDSLSKLETECAGGAAGPCPIIESFE